jgi:sec-independent protein translocase protein TatC
VATITPSQRRGDPEGRMPLREHLRELRKRVVRAGLAVLAGTVAGWFLYDPVFAFLTGPIRDAQHAGRNISINFAQVGSAFDLRVKMSVWLGVVVSSPLWIYQLWAFITPGLTRKERRYALGFVGAAVPLFLSGVYLALLFVPNAVEFFTSFTPSEGTNLIQASDYLGFVMRTALAFGAAFLLPVVLVALNFTGVLSGRALLKSWRWVTVAVFAFAAIATPTPDVWSMFWLAIPMLLLFALAIGIALLHDRRRVRSAPDWGDVDDDTASPL